MDAPIGLGEIGSSAGFGVEAADPRNGVLVAGRDLPAVPQPAAVCIQSTPAADLPACSAPASWQGTEVYSSPAGL